MYTGSGVQKPYKSDLSCELCTDGLDVIASIDVPLMIFLYNTFSLIGFVANYDKYIFKYNMQLMNTSLFIILLNQ